MTLEQILSGTKDKAKVNRIHEYIEASHRFQLAVKQDLAEKARTAFAAVRGNDFGAPGDLTGKTGPCHLS